MPVSALLAPLPPATSDLFVPRTIARQFFAGLSYHSGMMVSRAKQADPRPAPRLYLVTPRIEDATAFVAPLTTALAAGDVAAVLLRLADVDERSLINRIKALVPVVQSRDAALVVDGHADLVARGGADGAHLTGIAVFMEAVGRLKPERIAGAGGLASRHDAMLAAETGADYVMFGEPDAHGARPEFAAVEERVIWWAEVFESPCVAYAASRDEIAPLVAAGADFVALGDWLWREPHNLAAIVTDAAQKMRAPEKAS
jgi:thiamine-phosphate pyrophosphorylase